MGFILPHLSPALQELTAFPNWVVHRSPNGGTDKRPLRVSDGQPADCSTSPQDWATYTDALACIEANRKLGVELGLGFVFTNTPYAGVDLDTYRTADPILIAQHDAITKAFNSYTESSPNGGKHILVKGRLLKGYHPSKLELECYSEGRYFTLTGRTINDVPIEPRQELLDQLAKDIDAFHGRNISNGILFVEEPRTESNDAVAAKVKAKFPHLWDCDPREIFKVVEGKPVDRSAEDFKLCKEIARLTRNGQQTLNVFRLSPRANVPRIDKNGREKPFPNRMKCWDRPDTYMAPTIFAAFADIDWQAENRQRDGFTVNGRQAEWGPQLHAKPINPNKVEVITMSSLTAEAITYLWDKWLPLGKLVLLAGAAGTGKSTLAFSFAAVVSAGAFWPDGTKAEQGHVLIWSSEDDVADTIMPRLQAMGANLDFVHAIKATTTSDGKKLPFNPATDMELLKSMMTNHGPTLLILDPIVSAITGDMNKSNEVRKGLQAVVDFASDVECCVLGISHFAKGTSGRNPTERVIGSVAFAAFARMVLVAAKDEETDNRVFVRAKSNISMDDGGFNYEIQPVTLPSGIETTRILWKDEIEGSTKRILAEVEHQETKEESSLGKTEEAMKHLMFWLNRGPQLAQKMMDDCVALGCSKKTVYRAQKRLGVVATKRGTVWMWSKPFQVDWANLKSG